MVGLDDEIVNPDVGKYRGQPFGGMMGDSVLLKVIAELVADPYTLYHNVDLAKMTRTNEGSVAKAMRRLVELKFVSNTTPGAKHPVYQVNLDSKRLLALTLLAYGDIDDRTGSRVMDDAIEHYCREFLRVDVGLVNYQMGASFSTGEGTYEEGVTIVIAPGYKQYVDRTISRPKAVIA